jgi:hypothetical protein
MSERYCNKCGYFGPDEIHNKPGHLYQCGYLSSPIQQPDTIQVSRAEYEELRRDAERWRIVRDAWLDDEDAKMAEEYADAEIEHRVAINMPANGEGGE